MYNKSVFIVVVSFVFILIGTNVFASPNRTICEEFEDLGGKFGEVSDAQKVKNTESLIKIFNNHNGLVFEDKIKIQTLNFCIETNDHSIIRNLILENFYTKDFPYTIGVKQGTSYQEITNLALICQNNEYCKYGIKYGFENKQYSEGCTLNNITLSNYIYPIILFTWNSVIGRIDCYKCQYGPILRGTSLSVGAIFCNGCDNGPILGAVLDEKGNVVSDARNAYLTYSNIDIISVDSKEVGFCLGIGYAKYINIGSIGMETPKSKCLIASFYNSSNTYNIGSIVPEYCPDKFYMNYMVEKIPDNVVVNTVFGENIYPSFETSDKVNLYVNKGNEYLTKLKNTATTIHVLTPSFGGDPIQNDVFFGAELYNGGGRNDGTIMNTSNSFGKYVGIITKNQEIRIRLKGSASSASSNDAVNRQIIFLGKLIVGDADQYNAHHVLGETLLGLTIDSYKVGFEYKVNQTNEIEGMDFYVDSSDDIPSIVIKFPNGGNTRSSNYIYSFECLGGSYTSVKVENNKIK